MKDHRRCNAYLRETYRHHKGPYKGNAFLLSHLGLNLKVIETEPGVRGDTATNVTKLPQWKPEQHSGPIFIEAGEVIQIDTREGIYLSRAKE